MAEACFHRRQVSALYVTRGQRRNFAGRISVEANMIKVILWDIDGTLLDFEMAEKYALRMCFCEFGIGECTDEMLSRYGSINSRYWGALERGEIEKEKVLTGRFEEFFRGEGIRTDAAAFNERYQDLLGDKVFFHDGGYELVSTLKGKVKQYAVTNGTSRAQNRKLEKSGLKELLDGAFISDRIGADKPDTAFFDEVRKQIGQYENNEIMIIGDSLTSDIQGGNRAGILCCWYNPGKKENHYGFKVDLEVQDLREIIPFITGV